MFSDHSTIKLEINNNNSSVKTSSIWKLNNILISDPCIKKKLWEIRKYFELRDNENTVSQNCGMLP